MATRLQKKIDDLDRALKEKNHDLKNKKFKPANTSYIKVEKICEELEINKEEYRSYLVNINTFVLYIYFKILTICLFVVYV